MAPEFSTFYGEAMDERHAGDYELAPLDHSTALRNLDHATRFVERIEEVLRDMGAIA